MDNSYFLNFKTRNALFRCVYNESKKSELYIYNLALNSNRIVISIILFMNSSGRH